MQKPLKHNLGYGYIPEPILTFPEIKEAFNHSVNRYYESSTIINTQDELTTTYTSSTPITNFSTSSNVVLPEPKDKTYLHRYLNYFTVAGDPDVTKTIANFFTEEYNCYFNPKNIQMTFGNTFGLLLALQATVKKGEKVLVEVPSFFNAIDEIIQANYEVVAIARNSDGTFDMNELEKVIVDNGIKGFYLVTSNSNPLGVSLPLNQKVELVRLAKKYKFYVFSDDIYEPLFFDDSKKSKKIEKNSLLTNEKSEELKTTRIPLFFCDEKVGMANFSHLKTFDNDSTEYIIYLMSFNKLISPQLKCGFMLVHSSLLIKFEHLAIGLALGFGFSQHIVRSYIELGYLQKKIELYRSLLQHRRDILSEALNKCKHLEFQLPSGGFFMFVKVKDTVNIEKVLEKREEFEVNLLHGAIFVPTTMRGNERFAFLSRYIRLSFSCLEEKELKEAGDVFVKLIEACVV